MSFGRDRQIRHYCEFLIAFVLLLFFSGMWAYSQQASIVRDLFLEHDRAVVTSLLEQGISEDVIARAITNTSGTAYPDWHNITYRYQIFPVYNGSSTANRVVYDDCLGSSYRDAFYRNISFL